MTGLETMRAGFGHRVGAGLGRVSSRARMLPEFLVVGGKRCGSTSLYKYLVLHPDVRPSLVPKGTHYFDVNYHRGWGWYRSKFPMRVGHGQSITGEASPYYMFHPLAPARIAAALPGVRCVAVLREPVQRAWSHYRYSLQRGFEDLAPEKAFAREEERLAGEVERMVLDPGYQSFAHRHRTYLARGRYVEHLEALYAHVPPERVLVLRSEDLFADPAGTCNRVFGFLGLPAHDLGPVPVYKAALPAPMPDGIRSFLTRYYEPWNDRLAVLAPGLGWGENEGT